MWFLEILNCHHEWMPHWFRTFSSSNKKIHKNTIKIIQASTSSNCNQKQINNKSKSLNSRIETFVSTIINLLKPLQTCLTVTRIREERIEGGIKSEIFVPLPKTKKLPFFSTWIETRYTSSCMRINLFHAPVMVFQLVPTGGFEWSSI